MRPIFVLAWVTREGQALTPMGEGGEVLFVEHPERGWEILVAILRKMKVPRRL